MTTHSQDVRVTVNEASYVLGQPSAVINKAVDDGIVKAGILRRGGLSSRVLGLAELRFYRVAFDLGSELTPTGRKSIYKAIRRLPAHQRRLKWGPFETDLTKLDREIGHKLKRLSSLKNRIEEAPGSDPLIRGTTVSAYVIAALAEGQTVPEIIEDYPGLSRSQIEAAIEYGKVYPKKGRPHPARSFKRMIGDVGASGLPSARSAKGPREIKL